MNTLFIVAMLGAAFVIVLVCSHIAFKKTSFFGDAGGWVIAVCVALLSVLGLVKFFGFPWIGGFC